MSDWMKIDENFSIDVNLFYNAIVRSTDDYIYVVDMKTDVALLSENMTNDFALPGRFVNSLIPLWGELVHSRDKERYFESINRMLNGDTDEHNVEYQVRNRKGEYVWLTCRGLLQRDNEGKPETFAGVVTNLSNHGRVDYITGLFSQRECERTVENLIQQNDCSSAIMLLGLDDFSNINNLNSHNFGDAVLRQFSQDIQLLLPLDSSIYRFDGDEFAIVCKNTNEEGLKSLYRKIQSYNNQKHKIDDTNYFCSVSAGITFIGQESCEYPDLIKFVADALEKSKRNGKNTYSFYSSDSILPKLHKMELSNRLRLCVQNSMEAFSVEYQPIIGKDGKKIHGAEALLRFTDTVHGKISPNEFIPLLEASGLIVPVGLWVLEQAVIQCKKWSDYCEGFIMNVNISYLQITETNFVQDVIDVLQKHELDPSHMVLELTESRFVANVEMLKSSFERLRAINIRLAMDDFGTGYSSLALLRQFPADIVKIDRSFIGDIDDPKRDFNYSFIGSVIQFCHNVGISVCVEGIERAEELSAVLSLNTDCMQGFFFSKPVSPSNFLELL